jgi:hypothetical protein
VASQTPKPVPPVEELEHSLVEAVVVEGRWRVRFTEDTRHSTPYDGEGFGASIEEALRAAIGDAYAYLFEHIALTSEDGTLDTARTAHALHDAVRAVRDTYPRTPSLWAAHLHAGA